MSRRTDAAFPRADLRRQLIWGPSRIRRHPETGRSVRCQPPAAETLQFDAPHLGTRREDHAGTHNSGVSFRTLPTALPTFHAVI